VKISWTRALKPLLDRRVLLEGLRKTTTSTEKQELTSLQGSEAMYRKLWPKLRRKGYITFDTIPRQDERVLNTTFQCPILGNIKTADILTLNAWLNTLTSFEGHITSLELLRAYPSLLPSVKSCGENPNKKRQVLVLLMTRMTSIAAKLGVPEQQGALFSPLLREVQEACLDLQRGGRLDGNPSQAYRTTDECTVALQVAMAVVDHNLPGLETQTCNPPLSSRPMQSFVSAAAQLEALTASLRESVHSLTSKADSRITRFSALFCRLYNKCLRAPQEKIAHSNW